MAVVEDIFCMSPESTGVPAMAMEMGRMDAELCQGSNQTSMMEAEKTQCECCRLEEECTPAYIMHIRRLYYGRWICGLCAEAVKEEHRRGGEETGLEDALEEHMRVCRKFNRPERIGSPVADIAEAVRRLLRRNTDLQCTSQSAPSSPRRMSLSRASSCFGSFPQGSKPPI